MVATLEETVNTLRKERQQVRGGVERKTIEPRLYSYFILYIKSKITLNLNPKPLTVNPKP
jgi:hypothetical protein